MQFLILLQNISFPVCNFKNLFHKFLHKSTIYSIRIGHFTQSKMSFHVGTNKFGHFIEQDAISMKTPLASHCLSFPSCNLYKQCSPHFVHMPCPNFFTFATYISNPKENITIDLFWNCGKLEFLSNFLSTMLITKGKK